MQTIKKGQIIHWNGNLENCLFSFALNLNTRKWNESNSRVLFMFATQIYGYSTRQHTLKFCFIIRNEKPAAVCVVAKRIPTNVGILDAVFFCLGFQKFYFTLLCSALLFCHMGKWFSSPNKYKSDRILFRPSSMHAVLIALALSKWMRKKNTNSDSIKSKQTIKNRIEINIENNIRFCTMELLWLR